LFNKKENQNYVGLILCEQYYNPNEMTPKNREAFQKWHKEQRNNNVVFDFVKEITEYCRSDVDILRRSCMEFRELFRNSTGINPFEKCLTIASTCQLVYRTNFLKENTIAILNSDRHLKMKQSNTALKWLSSVSEKEGICIEHVRNGGEKRGRQVFPGWVSSRIKYRIRISRMSLAW
jgi:exonuclease I